MDFQKKKTIGHSKKNEIILIYHHLTPSLNPIFPSYQKFKNFISKDII